MPAYLLNLTMHHTVFNAYTMKLLEVRIPLDLRYKLNTIRVT